MAGSSFGTIFKITTWGESHGKALGVVIDGCPAGLSLDEADIQQYLDRRKPGQSKLTTNRKENDQVQILSGVFEGKTTGTPISLLIPNTAQISSDYDDIANVYRPGHADYTYDKKYGFRDYRGGGRSSGRETVGRVAAGAIACKILKQLGVSVNAYTRSIHDISIDESMPDWDMRLQNITCMPDKRADEAATTFLEQMKSSGDSVGGCMECIVTGVPAGIGDPVFDKLDANLAKAIMSIGAVKSVEIGDGSMVAAKLGSENNDALHVTDNRIQKCTNHAGGILGGISDGDSILIRAFVKPTPSIAKAQDTCNKEMQPVHVQIKGRHDPIIVPRAVVVMECMTALTILDAMLLNLSARMESLIDFYH